MLWNGLIWAFLILEIYLKKKLIWSSYIQKGSGFSAIIVSLSKTHLSTLPPGKEVNDSVSGSLLLSTLSSYNVGGKVPDK